MELDFGKQVVAGIVFFGPFRMFFAHLLLIFDNCCSFVKREAPVNSNGGQKEGKVSKVKKFNSKGAPFGSAFAYFWARIFHVFFDTLQETFFRAKWSPGPQKG